MTLDVSSLGQAEDSVSSCFLIADGQHRAIICERDRPPQYIYWTDCFGQNPIGWDTLDDGSWPVEVKHSTESDCEYVIYWFYPFQSKVHTWYLNATGDRVGGRDLNEDEKLKYLISRSEIELKYLYRLFDALRVSGTPWVAHVFTAKIISALSTGDVEAAYTICNHQDCFTVSEILEAEVLCQSYFSALSEPSNFRNINSQKKIELEIIGSLPCILAPIPADLNSEGVLKRQTLLDYTLLRASLPWLEASSNYCFLFPRSSAVMAPPPISAHWLLVKMNVDFRSIPAWNFEYQSLGGSARDRILDTVAIMDCVGQSILASIPNERLGNIGDLFVEAGDIPINDRGVVAIERHVGNESVLLIPDVYFFRSLGYRWAKLQQYPPWQEKNGKVIWRGSTTGNLAIDANNFQELPRIKLCLLALEKSNDLDFGITAICQATDDQAAEDVDKLTSDLGIRRDFIAANSMGDYKYIVDIDGNSNSWGFLEKLIYGSCILKVESPYEQWFYSDLIPWEHFVPIKADLSNLLEMVDWCLSNEAEAEAIGARGRAFAMGMDFKAELDRAGRRIAESLLSA